MSLYKLSLSLVVAGLVAGCNSDTVTTESTFATDSAAQAQAAGISHGEYVARLGNCVACHSTPEGEPLAGGLKMAVPMLGNIYATNITPDPQNGIGEYSFDEFDRVMRAGVARDGHRLYPAMPYPSYAKMSEQDMRALYDFLMNDVQASAQPNLPEEIEGIRDVRWAMGIWNVLAAEDDAYEPVAGQSDGWNRGAYLVQGLGHCGACHGGRNALGASDGGLGGGILPGQNWYAPALDDPREAGVAGWPEAEVLGWALQGGRHQRRHRRHSRQQLAR